MNRRSLLALAGVAPALALPAPAVAGPAPLTTDWKSARWIIMPDYFRGRSTKTQHDNCWTIHHHFMIRTTPDNPFGYEGYAHSDSRTYRDWLAEGGYWESDREQGIPPHIQFGGAVRAGSGDPTFHQRWVEYARREFGLT